MDCIVHGVTELMQLSDFHFTSLHLDGMVIPTEMLAGFNKCAKKSDSLGPPVGSLMTNFV